jgi:tetratricopeptide (TPR) repeat protein
LEVLALLALLSNRLGDAAKAQDWLDQARLSLEKHNCADSIVVARYFQASGEITATQARPEEATGYYQEALKRLDNFGTEETGEDSSPTRELCGEIYFDLGQLLRQLGRYEEALDFIEKAYRLQ